MSGNGPPRYFLIKNNPTNIRNSLDKVNHGKITKRVSLAECKINREFIRHIEPLSPLDWPRHTG